MGVLGSVIEFIASGRAAAAVGTALELVREGEKIVAAIDDAWTAYERKQDADELERKLERVAQAVWAAAELVGRAAGWDGRRKLDHALAQLPKALRAVGTPMTSATVDRLEAKLHLLSMEHKRERVR